MRIILTEKIRAYIGLGSNLAQPIQQIIQAKQLLNQLSEIEVLIGSSLYRSPPFDGSDQPDYINAVIAIETDLSPMQLLKILHQIEQQQGRTREYHWAARTLDLDILLYGQQIIQQPDLIIPHLGLTQRAFVLYPLFEIAPELTIPNYGRLIDLLANCPLNGLEKCQ
ncbi:MAG: hypothetical protein RL637_1665 [Pseudomonadota bacterium]|jgi:2-amino-4-hydroxy-6-hydroxymethyldihydropteridine diphosphokinase